MKILKILGAIIVIIILTGIVLYFNGPNSVYMERTITINSSPTPVYQELNTFETFNKWSPWYQKDSLAKYHIEGPAYGPGAHLHWNSKVLGEGSMIIDSVKENQMVLNKMDFGYGTSYARYIIEEQNNQQETKLTWTYEEEPQGMSKIMYNFMNIESLIATDYEQGLKNFKAYIEAKPAYDTDVAISVVEAEPITYLGISATVSPNTSQNISNKMGELYGQLMGHMESAKIEMGGMPLAVFTSMGEDEIDIVCGIPAAEGTTVDHETIEVMNLEGGKAIKAIHMGDYKLLTKTHEAVDAYMANNNLEISGNPYEIYVTDPGEVKDTTQWITHVFYPVQ